MKLYSDLHIHSCLSPCGDELMTPNNIVNMAYLKELDVIAVCDHNTAENLPACQRVAHERGIVLVPGIEVTTSEEVHVLLYLGSVEAAVEAGRALRELLPPIDNTPAIFGEQIIMDENDEPINSENRLLISATSLSVDELCEFAENYGGICVPAHINRGSTGLLVGLGFIPPGAPYAALEVSPFAPAPTVDLSAYKILRSSDAHYLENILEREAYIESEEKTLSAVFEAIRKPLIRH